MAYIVTSQARHSTNDGVLLGNPSVLNADERRPVAAETRPRTRALRVLRSRLYRSTEHCPSQSERVVRFIHHKRSFIKNQKLSKNFKNKTIDRYNFVDFVSISQYFTIFDCPCAYTYVVQYVYIWSWILIVFSWFTVYLKFLNEYVKILIVFSWFRLPFT